MVQSLAPVFFFFFLTCLYFVYLVIAFSYCWCNDCSFSCVESWSHSFLGDPISDSSRGHFACHCPHKSKGSMYTGFSVVSREKFQNHPALTLLLEILLDSSFQLFSIFLKEPHAGTCKEEGPNSFMLLLLLSRFSHVRLCATP